MSEELNYTIEKLSKDLRTASRTLGKKEAQYLVDTYYQVQKERIAAEGRVRAASTDALPHDMMNYITEQMRVLERQIAISLDVFSANHPIGPWLRGVVGIGPIIAAGFLAYIDIHKAPTASHIYSYAGLDPQKEWRSRAYIDNLLREIRDTMDEWPAFLELCSRMGRKPLVILHQAELIPEIPTAEDAFSICNVLLGTRMKGRAEFSADAVLKELLGSRVAEGYENLVPQTHLKWSSITKALSRRPFSRELKVLCWKAGESFIKQSGNPNCTYGHIYQERKRLEIERNARGEFAAEAAKALKRFNYGKETISYKRYIEGKLPDGHIHARARRFAVKMFLSDLHAEMCRGILGTEPPKPYAIAHLNHAHLRGIK